MNETRTTRAQRSAKLHDELLSQGVFCAPEETKVMIENWHRDYGTIHPHDSRSYQPPAPRQPPLSAPAGVPN